MQAALSLRKLALSGLDPVDADAWIKVERRQAAARVNATMAKAELRVDATVPLIPGRAGDGAPKLAETGPIAVEVKSNQIQVQELPILRKQLARRGVSGGSVNLVASVNGDIAHPDAKLALDLRDLEIRRVSGQGRNSVLRRLPGVGASLNVDTERGAIKVAGQALLYGTGLLTFASRLGIDPGAVLAGQDVMAAPVTLDVKIPRFHLASLQKLDDHLRDTEGALSGSLALRGTLGRPTGRGELLIEGARVGKLRFGPIKAHGETDGELVKANLEVQQEQGGTLAAHADIRRGGAGSQQRLSASALSWRSIPAASRSSGSPRTRAAARSSARGV